MHCVQRGVLKYFLEKSGLGAPALGGPDSLQFSVTDNGVGDYTLNLLDEASEEDLQGMVQSLTSGIVCRVGVKDSSSIQVLCFSDLAETTPAEGDFYIEILKRKRSDKV